MKTELKYDEDGTPRFNYVTEAENPAVIATGPVTGPIVLNDGTVYDVTPDYIEHDPKHTNAILYHIEKWHEKAGTFGKDFKASGSDDTKKA